MRVITSGSRYIDIDAYAGIVAFAQLLRAQGQEAVAISTSPLNDSIPQDLRNWKVDFRDSYEPTPTDTFTLIDVSIPQFFDPIVDLNRVDEVIDHHPGEEKFWAKRKGVKTEIEFIGAACTQVYERWKKAGLLDQMSKESAGLLASGILDNTLNFGAKVTTTRDKQAYEELARIAQFDKTWPEHYFWLCEQAIMADLPTAIANDSKVISFKTFRHPISVGQLVVWDAQPMISSHLATIDNYLSTIRPNRFMNLISLKDRCSYLLSMDADTRHWLTDILAVAFDESVGKPSRPWLRKEIIMQDLQLSAQRPS